MDAGVPHQSPGGRISCGLITEGDRWMTMLDIQGVEDFHGDMDFKVGGTRKGITAIQMDIKIDGLTYDIIADAFEKCRKGRLYILDEIIKPSSPSRATSWSRWAPKMFSMRHPTDKIKDVIGKGGKVIQEICANCNCKIDVQEDGHVFVSAIDQEDAKRAIFTIKTIVEDPEIGAIYKGKVTRLMNFGRLRRDRPRQGGSGPHLQAGHQARGARGGCGGRRRRHRGQGDRHRPAGPDQPVPPRRHHRAGSPQAQPEQRLTEHSRPSRRGRGGFSAGVSGRKIHLYTLQKRAGSAIIV